jgi:hypothetical protein
MINFWIWAYLMEEIVMLRRVIDIQRKRIDELEKRIEQ